MTLNKNDFIEIEFTGKIKGTDEIFDTTKKEDAKLINLDEKKIKPFILSVGNEMLPKGFDNDLEGKEVGKEYTVNLTPEEAFGKRNSKLVRMLPLKIFHEQNIQPQRGMQLNLDGKIARVLSTSGGRVLVDFNSPLAGKDLSYDYKILRKVEDKKEQVDAVQDFLFRKKFSSEIKDKEVTLKLTAQEGPMAKYLEAFKEPFKKLTGLNPNFVVEKISDKKESEEGSKK